MARSLKEVLQSRDDYRQRTIKVERLGGEEITIRRMTVGERKTMVGRFRLGQPEADPIGAGIYAVATCCVPPMTEEEVAEVPSAVVDEISAAMIEFNGWGTRGAAEIADQFRPSA